MLLSRLACNHAVFLLKTKLTVDTPSKPENETSARLTSNVKEFRNLLAEIGEEEDEEEKRADAGSTEIFRMFAGG